MTDGALRVMVVDDHPMWRDAVERDLTGAGMEVVATAATGEEALVRARATRPAVVVLDLQIPAPNGVEVTARLVREDPTVRVLILEPQVLLHHRRVPVGRTRGSRITARGDIAHVVH